MYFSGITGLQLLVLQPTPFCNLNCSYCYLPDRSNRSRMDDQTLESVGRHIVASSLFSEKSTIVWHAGEPLVLSPDWYISACETLGSASGRKSFRQSFQTNATLIDDRWVEYFAQPEVTVGVSLDGPEALNDKFRHDRKGRGTWRSVMKGIQKLHDGNIPFHIICVVTAASLDKPKSLAEALINTGAQSIGLNIEEIDGINRHSSLLETDHQSRVRAFLNDFIDVLDSQKNPPRLRERDTLNRLLAVRKSGQTIRNQENAPGAILSVDVRGGVSTFSPELLGIDSTEFGNFNFGNINEIRDLSDIYLNRNFLRCQKAISAGVAQCKRNCGYFPLCGGGTPANKFGETQRLDVMETSFCQISIKTVLDSLLNRNIAQAKSPEIECRE